MHTSTVSIDIVHIIDSFSQSFSYFVINDESQYKVKFVFICYYIYLSLRCMSNKFERKY